MPGTCMGHDRQLSTPAADMALLDWIAREQTFFSEL